MTTFYTPPRSRKSAFCLSALRVLTTVALMSTGPGSVAQQTYALKPYSVTLPKLNTVQQGTVATQQAGNLVYNTDAQTVAFHNGNAWQYVHTNAPEAGQFTNRKLITANTTWVAPAGVTRVMVEVWGAGGGGEKTAFTGTLVSATGGGAGSYARSVLGVTPGVSLTLTVGVGGAGATPSTPAFSGGSSFVNTPSENVNANGGDAYGNPGYIPSGTVGFGVGGGGGSNAVLSYGQRSASEFVLLVQCGNGGTAYGAQPAGYGAQFALLNSSSLLYKTDEYYVQKGSFPGGGGGAGYTSGGRGGDGMIVIHW